MLNSLKSAIICSLISFLPMKMQAQNVPGYTVTVYASLPSPAGISFDTAGNLYVGRDNANAPGTDNNFIIRRIPSGGGSVFDFSLTTIQDPDTVFVDRTGVITGVMNTVLIGHSNNAINRGTINAISPTGVVTTFIGPSTQLINPQDMKLDAANSRLLIVDNNGRKVCAVSGGVLSTLFSIPNDGVSLALDSTGNIFVATKNGRIRKYSGAGVLLNDNFVSNAYPSHLEFGRGDIFGSDLYCISGGNLVRYNSAGNATVIGTGFNFSILGGISNNIEFGYDGALYVSEFGTNRILRIIPNITISGTVLPESAVNRAQSIDFTFRPSVGSAFTRTVTLDSGGGFRFSNIPADNYTVSIKGAKWLRKNIGVDARLGNVPNANATLLAGDANNDNVADITDLLLLIAHYNQASPNAGFLVSADFNCDGINDIADLLLLIGNYNKQGDV